MTNTTKQNNKTHTPQWWGMAGVFPGKLGVYNQGDPWFNKLNFITERGFHGGGISANDLNDPEKTTHLQNLCNHHSQSYMVHYDIPLTPQIDITAEQERLLQLAKQHLTKAKEMPLPMAQMIVSGGTHRFTTDFPIQQQLSLLQKILTPIVHLFAEENIPTAIENHGDYYMSDLVDLCTLVPGLSIMFDTGNAFLIGERADLIPDQAYPLISCTHYKDHLVFPQPTPTLSFQIKGATLGQGHVGLDAIYHKLLTLHPNPSSIKMMIEWVPDENKNPIHCLNQSMDYIAKQSNGHFQPQPFNA